MEFAVVVRSAKSVASGVLSFIMAGASSASDVGSFL